MQRHHLKMYDVLPLEIIATIRILEFFYRFFSKWVFSDTNLITFTVMASSKLHVPTVPPIIRNFYRNRKAPF